jgi:SAM-dependent methyltransferase/uncharacterized protein YbaR (Trm112 family)
VYIELLPYLRCPACRDSLRIAAGTVDDQVLSGELVCAGCLKRYPIRDGIVDLLGPPRPPTLAQVANELPITAQVYEAVWRPMALTLLSGERFPYERELPLILDLVGVARGGLFIDVACSNGLYARALARALSSRNGLVAGIDHSLPMLQEARRRAQAAGVRVSYLRAGARSLPFAAEVAAGVTIGGSLNEIGSVAGCAAEVQRVLAPSGRLASMSLARASSFVGRSVQFLLAPGGVRFFATQDLLATLAHAGLRPTALLQYGIVDFVGCVASNTEGDANG